MSEKEKAAANAQKNSVANAELKVVKLSKLKLHPKLEGLYSPTDGEQTNLLIFSIKDRGLINKIIVTRKMEILTGKRRLGALLRLGYEEIEVEEVDIPDDEVIEFAISSNQQRPKKAKDQLNEINWMFDLYAPGQGKKGNGTSTKRKIEIATGMKTSKIDKLRSIGDHALHLIDKMDDKGMSLSAAYNEAMLYKRMKDIAKEEKREFKPLSKDEKLANRFTESVSGFLEKKSPEHMELVNSGKLSAKDAYDEVANYSDYKNRMEPKCECPYCNASVEKKKLMQIATLDPEKVVQILEQLKVQEMVDVLA